ncbi:MAG: hypothetical protein ACHP7F_01625 [Actinomycetales bacterium]|jgi:FtsZ-binding cell division protein ZapB|nr:hypothetical protein [Leifsonia sp.]
MTEPTLPDSKAAGTPEVSSPTAPRRTLLDRTSGIYAAHKLLILGIFAGIVVLGVAVGWIVTSVAQQGVSDSLRKQLSSARSTITEKQADIDQYRSRQDAVQQAQDQLKQDQAKLATDQASLQAGQAALAAQTQLVQASQFEDGQYTVGQTLAPGVYRETAGGECYYEWSSSTAADASIVSNDIPQGPATVTLRAGDIFTSSNCGTWTKVG